MRYDGVSETAHANFVYECSHPDLLKFEQQRGKYTGRFSVEQKNNNKPFTSVDVTVTVRCADDEDIEPRSILITVTDAKPLSILFYKNIHDTESIQINIYRGYSINQVNKIKGTSMSIPSYRPSDDFDVEWYDKKNDERVNIDDDSIFYEDRLELYARYRLNKPLTFIDELTGDEKTHDPSPALYYGETIEDEELLKKLRKDLESADGWFFDGWVPDIENSVTEKRFKDGLGNGKYICNGSVLYAKWRGEIYFSVDSNLGRASTTTQKVVYNGRLSELPTVEYFGQITKNKNDIKLAGWYTKKYGDGDLIAPGRYSLKKAGLTFYDKTLIKVYFNDELNKDEYTPLTVIYGKTLLESRRIGGNGTIPKLNDTAWIHAGWSYSDTDSGNVKEYVTDSTSTFSDKIWNVPYVYSQANPQFIGSLTFNAIWELNIKYVADIGNIENFNSETVVRFADKIELPENSIYSWSTKGWYVDNVVYNKRIEDNGKRSISSSSQYFLELANSYAVNHTLFLYAKWGKTVTLVYGNGKREEKVDVVYGKAMGNKLPIDNALIGPVIEGFTYATEDHWKTEDGIAVNPDTVYYPLKMNRLVYQWQEETVFDPSDYLPIFITNPWQLYVLN